LICSFAFYPDVCVRTSVTVAYDDVTPGRLGPIVIDLPFAPVTMRPTLIALGSTGRHGTVVRGRDLAAYALAA